MWATHSGDHCKSEIENLDKNLTADGKPYCSTGMEGVHILRVSIHRLIPTLISMKMVSMSTNSTVVCCVGRFKSV